MARDVTVDRDNCVPGNNPEIQCRYETSARAHSGIGSVASHDADGAAPDRQYAPAVTLTEDERRAILNGAHAMEEDAEINAIANEHLAARALWHSSVLHKLLRRTET